MRCTRLQACAASSLGLLCLSYISFRCVVRACYGTGPEELITRAARVHIKDGNEFLELVFPTGIPTVLTGVVSRWMAYKTWTPEHLGSVMNEYELELQLSNSESIDRNIIFNATLGDYSAYMLALEEPGDSTPVDIMKQQFPDVWAALDRVDRRFLEAHPAMLFYANYDPEFFEIANGAGYPAFQMVNEFRFLTGKRAQHLWDSAFTALGFWGHFEPMLWIGPRGVITGMHQEWEALNFLHQVYGTKELLLYPSSQVHLLYPSTKYSQGALNSPVKPFDPLPAEGEEDPFPLFRQAVALRIVLEPGEMLWIPAGWWHTVRSLSLSISVTGRVVSPCQEFTYIPSHMLHQLHLWGLYKRGNCICHASDGDRSGDDTEDL